MTDKKREWDFGEYLRVGEPEKREKALAWSAAIGLQQVDGLTPSKYLYETALRNIEGDISIDDAKKLIDSYYESKTDRVGDDENQEEADKVSSRIAKILSEKSFHFSPSYLMAIHGKLFDGIYKFAGKIRHYDITKNEWVLNNDSVMYASAFEIKMALDYDFEQERNYSYNNLDTNQIITHLAYFVSRLWQIHAFSEGNTRTTAVFTIKYLRSLGFHATNEIFANNSWYFRNALVRANYQNVQKKIYPQSEFLERFFRNMLLGETNELKNRFLHINYTEKSGIGDEKSGIGDEKSGIEKIVNASRFNSPTKARILKLVYALKFDEIFGASTVMGILSCKATAATAIIQRMKDLTIIEAVTGHGKGKYRLARNPIFFP